MSLHARLSPDGPQNDGATCLSSAVPAVMLVGSYAPSLWLFRSQLIAELKLRGYRVFGCAPDHTGAAAKMRALGAEFVPVGPNRTSVNPLGDLVYFWRLMHLYFQIRPAAVITYTAKPVVWGSLAARVTGVGKVLAIITGLGFAFSVAKSSPRSLVALVTERLYRCALRGCHTIIFQNPDDQKEFAERHFLDGGQNSLVVNGSGVDLSKFRAVALPSAPIFLLVARMLHEKGIREFCEAAARIKLRYPEACFRLVGWFDSNNPRGISPDELEAWCSNRVAEYRGPVDDVRNEMEQCRIYVLPSYREGIPRTVLEAMAMGRPIITTDAPGCRETVRDGWNGYLVPVRDSVALAEAMERLLANPRLAEQMGANSRLLAESKYDAREVAEEIVSGAGL